jgi:DeoR/GlpR family transcriptional regulator of sugar metabolism
MSTKKRNPIARRRTLHREIVLRGAVSVIELSNLLNASPATIRRDLAALDAEGVIEKGYGGASSRTLRPAEEALDVRANKFVPEKKAIAHAALKLIKPGDTLFLNDGSTQLALAHSIALTDLELFVVTSAVNIAMILANSPTVTVCLLGGLLRQASLATGGHFALSIVDQVNADLAILSCDAFSMTDGMCFMHPEDAAIANRMSAKATRTIALVHMDKVDWKARISSVPLADIDVYITEGHNADLEHHLKQANVEIVVADLES